MGKLKAQKALLLIQSFQAGSPSQTVDEAKSKQKIIEAFEKQALSAREREDIERQAREAERIKANANAILNYFGGL